jgi:hypothetical protein
MATYDPALLLNAIRIIAPDEISSGYNNEDESQPFVWLTAWPGELQYFTAGDMAGQLWWFEWDRTHAVRDEKELEMTPGLEVNEAAAWLVIQSAGFVEFEEE